MARKRVIGARWVRTVGVALWATGLLSAPEAPAVEVYSGDRFRAQLDTTLSLGMALRVQGRNNELIFKGNDPGDRTVGSLDGFFTNADDGNLNYDKGDVYSVNVKSTFDLELDYRVEREHVKSLGALVRASVFYDFLGNCSFCTRRTPLSEPARKTASVLDGGVVGTQWIFLDMYADGLFELADRMMSLRFGNQVLSWGESLFIPGGVSATNAFDVTKLRIAGSELKEAFVPAPIVRVSSELIGDLSMEAYYQFDWNRTNVDPLGSYFSTNDLVGRGRSVVLALNTNDPGSGCTGSSTPPGCVNTGPIFPNPNTIPRSQDDTPSNQGQWGIAARYFWQGALTEFGAYYMRYHSKTPVVGLTASAKAGLQALFPLDDFFRQYADDIDMVGFSFNTEVLNSALAGEISYRPNDPTPIVAQGLAVRQALGQAGNPTPFTVDGFVREKRIQAQLSLISTLGVGTRMGIGWLVEQLRMDNVAFTTEIGVINYPDLSPQCSSSVQALVNITPGATVETNCTTYAGVGPADPGGPVAVLAGQVLPRSSGVDATSAGYSFLFLAPYTNPLGVPITLTPSLAFSHDFSGTAPNQTFIEGRKAVTVGLEVDYLGVWGAMVTYANFVDGGNKILVQDRDFVSLAVSYSF